MPANAQMDVCPGWRLRTAVRTRPWNLHCQAALPQDFFLVGCVGPCHVASGEVSQQCGLPVCRQNDVKHVVLCGFLVGVHLSMICVVHAWHSLTHNAPDIFRPVLAISGAGQVRRVVQSVDNILFVMLRILLVQTNCCVESTMRAAYEKGYDVITLNDCTAATSLEEQVT